ncbi:uncharacterized protein LOC144568099 [Carex rostrata]
MRVEEPASLPPMSFFLAVIAPEGWISSHFHLRVLSGLIGSSGLAATGFFLVPVTKPSLPLPLIPMVTDLDHGISLVASLRLLIVLLMDQCSDTMLFLTPYNGAFGSNGEKNDLAVISAELRSFDEKLTALLREPFDQREYEALMNEAIRRKSVMKHRNLRNMSKRYHTHEAGQSYLDYYPDLAIQISEANKYERLNLLRKFFFWLENLCHDGAYMPWVPITEDLS